MSDNEILELLNDIFRQQIKNNEINLEPTMTSKDVKGWDSLRHAMIMAEIQKKFSMKFSLHELVKVKSVGDMIRLIHSTMDEDLNLN